MRVSVKTNESSTASTTYALQDSLFYIGSDSKVYYLQEVEDERYELIFGDGIFGKKLEEVIISLLTTLQRMEMQEMAFPILLSMVD